MFVMQSFFFFSSRRRHTRWNCDWSSDVCSSDLVRQAEQVRSSIGVTGQFAAVDQLLTGEENLRMMARLAHLDRATRSEERRVGKECRSRWGAYREKKRR